jgi:uncharacterized coiled-coil DUF342 family protein
MPKEALADTLVDWDQLIEGASSHGPKRPEIKQLLEALRERRDRAKELDHERQSLQARRQKATQDLRQVREEGKELASRLRSMLKSVLGSQNEALVQFNVRPRRPYGPRKTAARRNRKKSSD